MSNVLTGLIPVMYAGLDIVQRELVGVIPGITIDPKVARAAVGQVVSSPVAPAAAARDIVPGVNPQNDGGQTIGKQDVTITKARGVPILWTGEEMKGINNGPGVNLILADQFAQAIRTLVNEIETDVVTEARKAASRAYGTAGTTPFGTANDLTDSSSIVQIVEDNGLGNLTRSLVLNSAAMNNVRGKQSVLFKANEAGTDVLLRQGVLGDLHGSQGRQSAQLKTVTPGGGSAYTTNTAGYGVGATAITLITGSGNINAGDVVSIAGDSNKYVVAKDLTGPGVLTIGAPGLQKAIASSATNVTVSAAFTPSILVAKSAIVLATRAPALPEVNGKPQDMAIDRMTISDPITGLSFEVSVYLMYRQLQYEVSIAWGQKAVKSEGIALLLG